MFIEIGRVEPWDNARHLERCNPADSILLRRYVDAVKLEQAMSHVSSKQAQPIFLNKLEKLSLYFNDQLSKKDLTVGIDMFICEIKLSLKFYFILVIVLMIWHCVYLRR